MINFAILKRNIMNYTTIFNELIRRAKEDKINITYEDISADILNLLLGNQKLAYILSKRKDKDKTFINESSVSQNACNYFKSDKSKYIKETITKVLNDAVKDYVRENKLFDEEQELKNSIKSELTSENIKGILNSLITKKYQSDETKELIDVLKLYLSKFEIDTDKKSKSNFITILPKLELKSCPYCKKEI